VPNLHREFTGLSRAVNVDMKFNALVVCFAFIGCNGNILGGTVVDIKPLPKNPLVQNPQQPPNPQNPQEPQPPMPPQPPEVLVPLAAEVEIRRLTQTEMALSLNDIFGVTVPEISALPSDTGVYGNEYDKQFASSVLIDGLETVGKSVGQKVLATPALKARVIPCVPTGVADVVCLKKVIELNGRKVWRRTLTAQEVTDLSTLIQVATINSNFDAGVAAVLSALIQDVNFVFRVELGVPTENPLVKKLSDVELATRMAFFFWGRTSPDWLITMAESGQLNDKSGVRLAASKLLESPLAKAHIERFHQLWLGYSSLPFEPLLGQAMRDETNALVNRAVWEKKDSMTMFTSDETLVNAKLFTHYGFLGAAPAVPSWVKYTGANRGGILSHGALLSNGAKLNDTNPTRRGKWVSERLFCQVVPPAPDNVDVDQAPSHPCRKVFLAQHATGSCAGCHKLMDPIGFGLEQYDQEGRFRLKQPNTSVECLLDGEGSSTVVGNFNGPKQLGLKMSQERQVSDCMVRQVVRMGHGRTENADDEALVQVLSKNFDSNHHDFTALMVDYVASDVFRLMKEKSL
jgi:Protein of unknown function (DUF1588)/Protein of unknown function (DUF1592)/Protein of unknown function (DUF1595)/Protein of unknown function (DUF1585)/Protein of unknown function (DUF1587)